MPVSLSFFASFKICCLPLNLLNQQMIVWGRPWCWPDWLQDLTWWHLSVSTSVAKPKLFFKTSWTFSSHVLHVSFGVSWSPSIRDCFFKTYLQVQLVLQKRHLDLKDLFLLIWCYSLIWWCLFLRFLIPCQASFA